MTYEFHERSANISDFLNQHVLVNEIEVEELQGMNVTHLLTDKGEITTTSEVIRKQALEMKQKNELPFLARIVRKGDQFKYFSFAKPEMAPLNSKKE